MTLSCSTTYMEGIKNFRESKVIFLSEHILSIAFAPSWHWESCFPLPRRV